MFKTSCGPNPARRAQLCQGLLQSHSQRGQRLKLRGTCHLGPTEKGEGWGVPSQGLAAGRMLAGQKGMNAL